MKEKGRGVSPQLNSSSNSAVTQPVGEARNVRRNQQIKALHLEFEDLKKKIKDVESKNQRIIQNIHKQYDFRKKPQTTDYVTDTSPIVHYEQPRTTLPDNPGDLSDPESRPRPKKQSNIKRNVIPSFHQSIEYRKTEHMPDDEQDSAKGNNMPFRPPSASQIAYSANSQFAIPTQPQEQFQVSQFSGLNPYQMSVQFPPFPSQGMAVSQVGSYYGNGFSLEDALKREREKVRLLEQELQERETEGLALKKLQKKYNTLTTACTDTVDQCLEEFFEEVIKQRLGEIDKAVKRSEARLKKLQVRLKDRKDREEDSRSRRLIEEHRSKRSQSRSRRESSPRQNYNSLTSMPRMPSKRNNQSLSINEPPKSKQSQQSRSSQQFEEIATQYQEMIKSKTKEVEAYELKLRQKEKELIEMTARCAKLEMRVSDVTETSKASRRSSEKEEDLLANLQFSPPKDAQILSLNKRISELEEILQNKQRDISLKDAALDKNNKRVSEYEAKIKKNDAELTKLREEYKRLEKEFKPDQNLSQLCKKLEADLHIREKQYIQLKDKASKHENEKLQCECENLTLSNKLKKLETLLTVKEEKICELEKIIQSNVGGEGDLLQKSMYLERIDQQDLHNLQADKDSLEEELAHQREQIFLLQKANQNLQLQCEELHGANEAAKHDLETLQIQNQNMRITLKAQEFEKYRPEVPVKQLLEDEEDCLSEQEEQRLREELQEVRKRLEESQSMLKLQSQKTFEENRKALKLTSELSYFREQLAEREDRYQKLRREHEEGKAQAAILSQQLQEREGQLQVERRVNADKIHEIEAQWLQFEQEVRANQQQDLNASRDHDELRTSRHFSEESFVNYRNTYNSIGAENERLQERLKQAEKVIEVQKQMQDKIVGEYRSNVDKLKAELREKAKECERAMEDCQGLRRKVRILQQSEGRLKEQQAKESRGEEMLLGNGRTSQLQAEVSELRELNNRLSAVEQQLFGQLGMKEQEVQELLRVVSAKQRRIEQLQDIVQLKEMNFSSHISQSQHNRSKVRESLQSQSSLRYSMLSTANRDRTMELQLSQAGESFFDQNQSMLSNVSQVFGRDEFPYQKMQLRRVEQRRLFEKTAAYIKSLKKAIDEKSKRIRLLERKIDSLRNSELIRKEIYEIREGSEDSSADEDTFRDYLSVQVERAHSQRLRTRQLEHQTKLTIQENNLLTNQIESLQEELMKAQEQENSLMKLKDLYKDEIKNLIKQNQDQAKLFEEELKKERTKLQQADSVQKMQALKQIFLKIVSAVVSIEGQAPKSKRREERRKELEDYLKVCCNLLTYDPPVREQLLANLKEFKK